MRWIAVRSEVVATAADGTPIRRGATVQDVTSRKEAEVALTERALTDGLTGLANRDRFVEVLTVAREQAEHPESEGVGVLLLDLDGFKEVNDGIGHHAGDLVLQEMARRVTSVMRGGDELAQLGGDEFAAVIAAIRSTDDAIAVAGKIRSALEAPFDLEGITVHVGASIGIVSSLADGDNVGTLLKRADVAMYRAKTLSSGWAIFTSDEDDIAAERLAVVNDLREALLGGHLDVVYQPILDTRTRRVSAFEALARWHHADRGTIPPDQFVPLAEQAASSAR